MPLLDIANDYQKAFSTNATTGSFPTLGCTKTQPSGAGVIPTGWANGQAWQTLLFLAFGTGNENSTFDVRIIGWAKVGATWVPTVLARGTMTLSQFVGVASGDVLATERFADTMSFTGYSGVTVQNPSSADEAPAWASLSIRGFTLIQVQVDLSDATAANLLLKMG